MHDDGKVALLIGMDIYNSQELDPLPSCKKDAESLAKLLSEMGHHIFGSSPLVSSSMDKEVNWVKVRQSIGKFFINAKPSQTLLLYFSGHGIPKQDEVYLATAEVNPKNPLIEGFSLSELTKLMSITKSKQVVCILDSCFSGTANLPNSRWNRTMSAKEDASIMLATSDRIWKKTPKKQGKYLLLSCQSYEKSWATETTSIYTKYLIEGLKGVKRIIDENTGIVLSPGSVDEDGNITPESLHEYVYYKVANQTNQVPDIKVDRASKIILTSYPELATKSSTIDTAQIIDEGDMYLYKRQYSKAIESFDKAIGINAHNAYPWSGKGQALYKLEDYSNAIQCFDRAIEINPNDANPWCYKGWALDDLQKYDQAMQCYDRALAIDPHPNVWHDKGNALLQIEKYDEAIQCFDKFLENQSNDIDV
jgi:tetratricopeptide (TPR) repeat protein